MASIILFGRMISVVSMCLSRPNIHVLREMKTYLKNLLLMLELPSVSVNSRLVSFLPERITLLHTCMNR